MALEISDLQIDLKMHSYFLKNHEGPIRGGVPAKCTQQFHIVSIQLGRLKVSDPAN